MNLVVLGLGPLREDIDDLALWWEMHAGSGEVTMCVFAVVREHRARVQRHQCLYAVSKLFIEVEIRSAVSTHRVIRAEVDVYLRELLPGDELAWCTVDGLSCELERPLEVALASEEVALGV